MEATIRLSNGKQTSVMFMESEWDQLYLMLTLCEDDWSPIYFWNPLKSMVNNCQTTANKDLVFAYFFHEMVKRWHTQWKNKQ